MNRQIECRAGLGIDSKEFGSANARNGEGEIVDQNRLPNHPGVAAETPLPVSVRKHHRQRGARAVIIHAEEASPGRRHAEPAEVISRHVSSRDRFGLSPGNHVEVLRIGVGE